MTYEHDFFVYRPLQPDSEAELTRLQAAYGAVRSFEPVEALHLTILRGHTKARLATHKLHEIMNNASPASVESSAAAVDSTQVTKTRKDVTRLAITLLLQNAPDDSFFKEYRTFRNAINRKEIPMYLPDAPQPHVTIGHLDAEYGLVDIMDAANELVGTTLQFDPTQSNVGPARVWVKPVVEAVPDRRLQPSTRPVTDTPIRTIRPGGIPAGLLSSMRPRNVNE